ncbi:hypothetical protein [Paracidovorax anthurii]|nr:hypothetical protein [Paracidovorax anthurii]WCM93631.1 hypothetical protein M5C99_02530 [Acidovorax sp. NCPPB 2350]
MEQPLHKKGTLMSYAISLAVATLSCAAYAIQVHAGAETAGQPPLREPAPLLGHSPSAPSPALNQQPREIAQ